MCTGIALALSEVPVELAAGLADRVYDRGGCRELQFHLWQSPAVIPVRWDGRLRVLPWGSRERRGPRPFGGWVTEEQVESGLFAPMRPEPVVIPANLGHHRGTWFLVTTGVRGIVLPTLPGGPVAYMVVRPSTNYYRNMTEQEPLMPVLVGQVI